MDPEAAVAAPATSRAPGRVGVVVPGGGTARRWGGRDKLLADVGGIAVLERLLHGLADPEMSALPAGTPVVVVGPVRALQDCPASVRWCREDPPGGGPVAALAAGLAALGGVDAVDVVVVVAGDQPFAAAAVPGLLAALGGADAQGAPGPVDVALAVDPDGRDQLLLAAYRSTALAGRLQAGVHGARMRDLPAGLRARRVAVLAQVCLDVDDDAALARARAAVSDRPAR
jgi:molybdopterin-guanine dinucleotide biosynthesis protein A